MFDVLHFAVGRLGLVEYEVNFRGGGVIVVVVRRVVTVFRCPSRTQLRLR